MRLVTPVVSAALAVGLAVCSPTRPAEAAPITATGAVSIVGVSTVPAGSIDLGTRFTFTFSLFSSGSGDLAVVPVGSFLVTAAITATAGSVVSFDAPWGDFVGTVSMADVSGLPANRVVDINALGVFTPQAGPPDLRGFDAGPMSLTFSATQTGGAGGSVSASYTIASPPVGVPEPMSLALLGAGLLGLGFVQRNRRPQPARA